MKSSALNVILSVILAIALLPMILGLCGVIETDLSDSGKRSARNDSSSSQTDDSDESAVTTAPQAEPPTETTAAPPETTVTTTTTTAPATTTAMTTTTEEEPPAALDGFELFRYDWTSYDGLYNCYIETYVNMDYYEYFRSLDRYYDIADWANYVDEPNNFELVGIIADQLEQICEQCGYTQEQGVYEVVNFVQNFTYMSDVDENGNLIEYPKYPIETIVDGGGDCEDTSILLASLLKYMDYGVILLSPPGHCCVGVLASDDWEPDLYIEYNGHKYLYIESTNVGWNIGDVPEEYLNETFDIYPLD